MSMASVLGSLMCQRVRLCLERSIISDPRWSDRAVRLERRREIDQYIAPYLATETRHAFAERAQRAGVPAVPVLRPDEFIEHTAARGFFRTVQHPGVGTYRTAGPPVIMARTPWRVDRSAPRPGEQTDEILSALLTARPPHDPPEPRQPPPDCKRHQALDDLCIVDFTRAFAGAMATMFFGFFGAEVIKIESADLDDGRQPGDPNYSELHRTKPSCSIDTRAPEGKALVKRLLMKGGIAVENFRPGVMQRLKLSYDELCAECPHLIMLSMPGFGNSGPLRGRAGAGERSSRRGG
jgi:crotonobetainyl-CoA:carnitine CoA-transferase CaiB-like acyl-CoA transferase